MRSYLRMMLFALGLLAGVQIPGLIDLYYQRLDARLQQASLSLAPFQETADQHFNGDLTALVNHYRTNPDPVFAKDAAGLQLLVSQRQTLQQESVYKHHPWYRQLSHLLLRAEPQLWQDTLQNYSYVVPLKQAYVVGNFQETQLTHVQPGQPVNISVDTFSGETLHGHVQSIAPATGVTFAAVKPDNATGNFTKVVQRIPVKLTFAADNPLHGLIRPGMSVEVTVDLRSDDSHGG